jgi:hypothetical protein
LAALEFDARYRVEGRDGGPKIVVEATQGALELGPASVASAASSHAIQPAPARFVEEAAQELRTAIGHAPQAAIASAAEPSNAAESAAAAEAAAEAALVPAGAIERSRAASRGGARVTR